MSEMRLPPAAVLDLVGDPGIQLTALDARGHPWLLEGEHGLAVLRCHRWRTSPPPDALDGHTWLHTFLSQLNPNGFSPPKPLPLLNGASLTTQDDAIWETLTYVPGTPLGWNPDVALVSAGAILARFHVASLAVPPTSQRPGALPMELCRPYSARAIAESFQTELHQSGHAEAEKCVVHGDCTVSNMLIDPHVNQVVGMIDFELAHVAPPESDISFALWVTGRTQQPDVALNALRIRSFIAGYQRERQLTRWAITAIPMYLVGRGLQMLVRAERFSGNTDWPLQRVRWLHTHRTWLEDVVGEALETSASGRS